MTTMTTRLLRIALATTAVSWSGIAAAQGSVGAQGFGYPTGGLSTRALGTGGSLAEFDPASPINPAALGSWGASPLNSAIRRFFGRTAFTAQYEPEFRRVTSGGASQSATLTRFPLVGITLPLRERYQLGVSATTMLDRTFSTEVPATSVIGGQSVTSTDRVEARGSIADVRLAAAANFGTRLSVGVGGHLLTGQNRVVSERFFGDTSEFGNVSDSLTVDYSGLAGSVGAEWRVVRGFSVAGSFRHGGTLRAERADTTLRSAKSPDRYGIGVRLDRVPGASFTAGYANTKWTNLAGLGGSSLLISDAPEYSLGVEAVGPRLGSNLSLVRLGGRQRTLPFGVGGAAVKETAFAGGFSLPLSGGRAMFDFTTQHATRTPDGGTARSARERAWTTSFGLTVRP